MSIETSTINIKNLTVDSHQNFLILDDDPDINEVIVQYLEITGFNGKFLKAETILEAKKHLKYEKIDYILSDWNLPDGQGISLLKAIRNSAKFRDLPFLMITGQDDIESMLTSSKVGSSEYLTKPFGIEEFQEKLINGWKSHTIPDQEKVHGQSNKIIELEKIVDKLTQENKELKEKYES